MDRPEWTIPLRPMSHGEVSALAGYNGERGRGVEHEPKVRFFYAVQQWRWNVERRETMLDLGAYAVPGGGWLLIGEGVPAPLRPQEWQEWQALAERDRPRP